MGNNPCSDGKNKEPRMIKSGFFCVFTIFVGQVPILGRALLPGIQVFNLFRGEYIDGDTH